MHSKKLEKKKAEIAGRMKHGNIVGNEIHHTEGTRRESVKQFRRDNFGHEEKHVAKSVRRQAEKANY